MVSNGTNFLDRVFSIVKDERSENTPLVRFVHPKELEAILDLDVTEGVSDEELERRVREMLHYSVKTHKATFRNQLFGATDPYGLAGAWITEAFNSSQYTFEVGPVFTLIELKLLDHILKLFGIPNGDGIFAPGGSMAIMHAIVAARYQKFPEIKTKGMKNLPEMVIFTSEDSHYSITKAAHWLGFGTEQVRRIPTNSKGQIIVQKLDEAIQEEKDRGRCPVFVNGMVGTTVLGAIDDIGAVADVCQKHEVWMHVDACWGGSLMLSPTHRVKLKGVESWGGAGQIIMRQLDFAHRAVLKVATLRPILFPTTEVYHKCDLLTANSLSWNPHKMMGAPLQCSLVLIREKGLLHKANSASAQYLFQQDKFYDVSYDTGDKSVQCGRKIDAFKLWMMWKARGDLGLSQLADQTMATAQFCLETVASRPGFKLVSDELQCPNICFWYIPSFMRELKEDEQWWKYMHKVTPKIKELLVLSSRLMVSYTPLHHRKNFFRLAFQFHPAIDEAQVLDMLTAIEECGETVTMTMLQETA